MVLFFCCSLLTAMTNRVVRVDERKKDTAQNWQQKNTHTPQPMHRNITYERTAIAYYKQFD